MSELWLNEDGKLIFKDDKLLLDTDDCCCGETPLPATIFDSKWNEAVYRRNNPIPRWYKITLTQPPGTWSSQRGTCGARKSLPTHYWIAKRDSLSNLWRVFYYNGSVFTEFSTGLVTHGFNSVFEYYIVARRDIVNAPMMFQKAGSNIRVQYWNGLTWLTSWNTPTPINYTHCGDYYNPNIWGVANTGVSNINGISDGIIFSFTYQSLIDQIALKPRLDFFAGADIRDLTCMKGQSEFLINYWYRSADFFDYWGGYAVCKITAGSITVVGPQIEYPGTNNQFLGKYFPDSLDFINGSYWSQGRLGYFSTNYNNFRNLSLGAGIDYGPIGGLGIIPQGITHAENRYIIAYNFPQCNIFDTSTLLYINPANYQNPLLMDASFIDTPFN